MTDKYKSPKEVAKELNLSEQTIWRMLRAGEMPAIRLRSGIYRIPGESLTRAFPNNRYWSSTPISLRHIRLKGKLSAIPGAHIRIQKT